MENAILDLKEVSRSFETAGGNLTVLNEINFGVKKGETVAIVGPSGSGKTTLLGICAGLDLPTRGEIELAGKRLKSLNEDARALLRRKSVGFIFQNFELIPTLTALENVAIPLNLQKERDALKKAKYFLDQVGLAERSHHYPTQLSGGEQQRVAIARAFVHQPEIVFADEPTGNLDEETGDMIEKLLFSLNRNQGTTLVLVTHNLKLAEKAGRIVELKKGKLTRDQTLNKTLA